MKIKVLHYIPGFDVGGIESRLLDWMEYIDRDKFEFVLIKMNDNDNSNNLRRFIELGGKYYNVPKIGKKNFFKYIAIINKIIKEEKIDAVHVHSLSSGIFPLIISKYNKVKVRILHSRTNDYLPGEKNIFIKKIIKKITPHFANRFFACSEQAGEWGIGKKKKFKVLKNGIDLPRFKYDYKIRNKIRSIYNISKDDFVVGTISRLCAQKNMFFLIDVFNELVKENEKYKLLIVGDGGQKKKIEEYVSKLNLTDNVIFAGSKINVWDYYMAFDVFLATSLYEGFGTTAIEAQATGVPSIVSDGFPATVEVSNYIKRLPLKENSKFWANEIRKIKYRDRTECDIEYVDKAGYNAKKISKYLEDVYLGKEIDY